MAESKRTRTYLQRFSEATPATARPSPKNRDQSKTCDQLTGQRFSGRISGRRILRAKKHTTRLALIRRHQLSLPANLHATGRAFKPQLQHHNRSHQQHQQKPERRSEERRVGKEWRRGGWRWRW